MKRLFLALGILTAGAFASAESEPECIAQTTIDDFSDESTVSLFCSSDDKRGYILIGYYPDSNRENKGVISLKVGPVYGYHEDKIPVKYRFDKGEVIKKRYSWSYKNDIAISLLSRKELESWLSFIEGSETAVIALDSEKGNFTLGEQAKEMVQEFRNLLAEYEIEGE